MATYEDPSPTLSGIDESGDDWCNTVAIPECKCIDRHVPASLVRKELHFVSEL